ncbi:histidine phosphatase family protein [uncultured Bifidobacterium sp.]|uniref:NUDIX hydrolase n=1 Tax=uncultured Bifidobacterium sp. TaxID=165187 RepID=UPI0028DC4986|nr:histidine phosphatase family protein [uncultured Bifidobacterium sp.]
MRHIVEAAGGIVYRRGHRSAQGVDGSRETDAGDMPDRTAPAEPVTISATDGDGGGAAGDQGEKPEDHDVEVCLVHRPAYDDWSWPKGKLEPNESHRHAAVREIGEETGCDVRLAAGIGEIEYPLDSEGRTSKSLRHSSSTKHIRYWMAPLIDDEDRRRRSRALGPILAADEGEIDRRLWLPLRQARRRLSHPTDRAILDQFVDRLEEGGGGATLIIVRHAKAEPRKLWQGTDAGRPITPKGAAAAYALNRELACFAPTRLVSSPWTRCLETLEVFSWQTGMPIDIAPELTEEAFAADPERAWQVVRGRVTECVRDSSATVICMHRPVIGAMFAHLRPMCASKTLASQLPGSSPYMPTGSAMVLCFSNDADHPTIIDIQRAGAIVY